MSASADSVVGAVLCGGASRRMGSDKALLPFDGVPMALRVSAALRGGGCSAVVAVGGDAAALEALGLAYTADLHPGEGPLGGVITALRHFAGHATVAVMACDLPLLTAVTVRSVLAGFTGAGSDFGVAFAVGDRPQPACAVWQPSVVGQLETLFAGGERRLLAAARAVGAVEIVVQPADLTNLNAPGDLPQ